MKCPHCEKTISFIPSKHQGSKVRVDYELIRKLKKSGLSYRAIAKKANCSIYAVALALAPLRQAS